MILDVVRPGWGLDSTRERGHIGFDAFKVYERSQIEGEIESFGAYFKEKLSEGRYEDLASPENRQFFNEYIELFDENTQGRLKAAVITPWLIESYKLTQNIVSNETPKALSQEPILRDGVASSELFDGVLDVFEMMGKFKATSDPWKSFAGLEQSPLFGENGFLRMRTKDRNDSLYQQVNLVILGMKGLSVDQLYSLFSYVQYERVSRAKIGKTPAVMAITLENNVPESDADIIALENKIKYGWGTPPGPGENIESRIVWKKGDVATAYEALVYAVEKGSYLSERYLAMMGSRKIKNLINLRQEVLAKQTPKGWNRPLWRDPTTGIVTNKDGAVFQSPLPQVLPTSGEHRGVEQKYPIRMILGLLGLLKTSKL